MFNKKGEINLEQLGQAVEEHVSIRKLFAHNSDSIQMLKRMRAMSEAKIKKGMKDAGLQKLVVGDYLVKMHDNGDVQVFPKYGV